ncbi:helix-turn-helix transcriptional regulator [Bradyrhizobium sp. 482_C4_N1_1]|uniref:helix-turn-helix transcriptional regulator n=1 Tax=unclassified Bradyrhizobium TaxID=2631580 RepID=UPI003F8BFB22
MTVYLQDKAVAQRYGVSRPSIWRWVKSDQSFPKPVHLSAGCSRWRLEDLERWEHSKSERNAA